MGPMSITPEEWQNFLLKLLGSDTAQENNQTITFESKEKQLLSLLGADLFREYTQATTDQERIIVYMKALGFAPSYDSSGSVLQDRGGLQGSQNTVNNLNTITVPPKVVPQVQIPPPTPPPAPAPTPSPQPAAPILHRY